jgi:hypothetical protein
MRSFRLLPVREPERLVLLDWKGNALIDGWGSGNLMSYPLCRDLQEQHHVFDGMFCRHPTTVNVSTGREHEQAGAEMISGSYFPVLGVRPDYRQRGLGWVEVGRRRRQSLGPQITRQNHPPLARLQRVTDEVAALQCNLFQTDKCG